MLLKKVTVLLEDESDSRSNLTKNLGSTQQPPTMCRLITSTKVYVYDIFGLMTMDSKITDYFKTRDGKNTRIIMLSNILQVSKEKIHKYIKK